jgi:outer membrane protein assembly factor BamA
VTGFFRNCLLILLLTAAGVAVSAQTPFFGLQQAGPSGNGLGHFEGAIIDSIVIDNRNIYDTDDARYDNFLFRTANRLHVVTRSQIVRQELLFEKGDSLSAEALRETARNLRARIPVNDAWIEVSPMDSGKVMVRVVTVDQWSLIGGLRSFEREGDRLNYRVGFEERNFLGRAQFVSIDYEAREAEPNFVSASYREPRTFGRPFALGIDYRSNPWNTLKKISLGRPYYTLSQSFSFGLSYLAAATRQIRFDVVGDTIAEWRTSSDRVELDAEYRWGPQYRKFGLFSEYRYHSQPITNDTTYDSIAYQLRDLPEDSTYHQFNVGARFDLLSFIVEHRINGFEYNEDITLGLGLAVKYGRAWEPGFEDHFYDLAEFRVSGAWTFGSYIVEASYERSFWFKGDRDRRRVVVFDSRVYNNALPFVTFAFRNRFEADRGEDASRLVLGGKSGVRGYETETSSGDRMHVLNLESRFFPGLEILSVKLGGALFIDLGRTWQRDDPITFKDYHAAFGGGLRISFEKITRAELLRMDLAVTREGDWEWSVNSGQYF